MKYRLIAVMFTSKCVLLLVIMISGVFQKDGNTLPFTGEEKLEDHPAAKHFQDVCIKTDLKSESFCYVCYNVSAVTTVILLPTVSISSGTGVPFNTIACGFSYLTGHAESNHVIVTMENIGSEDLNMFTNRTQFWGGTTPSELPWNLSEMIQRANGAVHMAVQLRLCILLRRRARNMSGWQMQRKQQATRTSPAL
ncbi:unnamed protein product [Dicrocoelium dendriticum]|nr:unnamed protein product [Dicrocoelium dendriticum]